MGSEVIGTWIETENCKIILYLVVFCYFDTEYSLISHLKAMLNSTSYYTMQLLHKTYFEEQGFLSYSTSLFLSHIADGALVI